ncbi:MAG TPA: DUF6134 family protein [Telmatospirillum sp.]|nr:DUF6134 family protein [Telmatospirillum sp.]
MRVKGLRRLFAVVLTGLSGALPVSAAELVPPVAGVLDFSIVRKGDVIGHYHSDFIDRADHALEVRTHVTAEVTLGPIRLYSLEHRSVETWRDGRLDGLVNDTEEDGEVHHLRAERVGQALVLTVDGKAGDPIADAVPSSLWSRSMLDGNRPIFDSGDGQLFQVTTRCDETAETLGVCHLSGDLIRTLRYAANGILAGLSFPAEDGSKVIYR